MIWPSLVAAALVAASPPTGDSAIDAFVADLAAGRRDAALARVYEMNSLSGRPNAVALANEFVDKLLECTFVSSETRNIGGDMYDLRWRCPDGDYFSLLDPNWRRPRVTVGEFVSGATREERRRNRGAPPPRIMVTPGPPPPEPSVEEVRGIVARYLAALRDAGDDTLGPGDFAVRFADGRANAFIGPEQLRRFLAPCRQSGDRIDQDRGMQGLLVRWVCAGPDALDPAMTTVMYVSGNRITFGLLWVGRLPGVSAPGWPNDG